MMRIAFIQLNISPEPGKNLCRAGHLCAEAAEKGAELILLPELFSTGFPPKRAAQLAPEWSEPTRDFLCQTAADLGVHLIAGCGDPAPDGKFYNRALAVGPSGILGEYTKQKLFSYAGEEKFSVSGPGPLTVNINNVPVSVFICYDLRFPELFRTTAKNSELMAVCANWPELRRTHWQKLLQARAIENQCYIAGVNRTGTDTSGLCYGGFSMLADPGGNIESGKTANRELMIAEAEMSRVKKIRTEFPFLYDMS